MVFLFTVVHPEKNNPNIKQIYGKFRLRVGFYGFPSPFHLIAPMHIVKHHDAPVVQIGEERVKIFHRRLVPMVAIYEHKVQPVPNNL